jgi:hypothetical protein
MGSLFGGGGEAKRAREESQRAAELSSREQQIANDRQLASLAAGDAQATQPRRNPRGRRLFTDKDTLA